MNKIEDIKKENVKLNCYMHKNEYLFGVARNCVRNKKLGKGPGDRT